MREIYKNYELKVDGEPKMFRLAKPNAFSGVQILRLFMRLQDQRNNEPVTVLDFIGSLSNEEMNMIMKTCLNNIDIILPAGPDPIMTQDEWNCLELKNDARSCLALTIEEISWTLESFFGEGGQASRPVVQTSVRQSAQTSTDSSIFR